MFLVFLQILEKHSNRVNLWGQTNVINKCLGLTDHPSPYSRLGRTGVLRPAGHGGGRCGQHRGHLQHFGLSNWKIKTSPLSPITVLGWSSILLVWTNSISWRNMSASNFSIRIFRWELELFFWLLWSQDLDWWLPCKIYQNYYRKTWNPKIGEEIFFMNRSLSILDRSLDLLLSLDFLWKVSFLKN